ncbi:hypothetical protein CPB84DRAFT_1853019 [Gymnopilus junonius]|uniref:P-loop containing nucleoside triphosphate hydrolase protein n=1 Tax=Gymnopilus junonius TaxID=109634 RepID=A0A9P5NBQ0_GYMJU|nr:hypothetical protein CPB84DRAFT_1853019 [Gymnopilus junonius]
MDSRVLPLLFTYVSFVWQLTIGISQLLHEYARSPTAGEETASDLSFWGKFKVHARSYGGYTIYGFMVMRFFGALSLVYLSAITPIEGCELLNLSLFWGICVEDCLPYTFVSVLFTSIILMKAIDILINEGVFFHPGFSSDATPQPLAAPHLGVYAYRDIWPLATYYLEPADIAEGNLLWAKMAIVGVMAVVIPLLIPNRYVPTDPKVSSFNFFLPGNQERLFTRCEESHAHSRRELVDPWISRATYTYLDSVIISANRVAHLGFDQLPALLDVDYASYLTKKAFPHLDPFQGAKRRHLFWGLLYYFRREYFVVGITIFINSICSFAGPIGINQVLAYLETDGENATIKPWLWIAVLFLGPAIKGVSEHWNLYLQTVVLVRIQALLTQLVFEHSLRIRLKAEASSDKPAPSASGTSTPKTMDSEEEAELSRESTLASGSEGDISEEGEHAAREENETQSTSTAVASSAAPSRDASQATALKESAKGKGKADSDAEHPVSVDAATKQTKDAENLLGRINNLVTSDLDAIVDGTDFLVFVLYIPIQILFSIVFLTQVLGWSALVGLLTTLAASPVAGFITKKLQSLQIIKMKMTDARVQSITESIGVIRMIKLFGWENKMTKKIEEKREEELSRLWKYKASPLAAKVSLDRITNFLKDTELLDQFTQKPEDSISFALPPDEEESREIGFRNATFSWSLEGDGSLTPSSRNFRLRVEGELFFKRNSINMIIGPTGSEIVLGEMHFVPSHADSWFNLPRGGGVAYAAQESWVQSATIKENILFGAPFDEQRYKKVLRQCALEKDIELFDAGDNTEVGERGLTLSGGQKARVTLARAIYSSADIILLDDVLAALDVHTSAWIVDKCFRGDLVKGRTILLVTHNIALVGPIAGFVVSLGLDGSVKTQGTDFSALLENDARLASEVEEEKKLLEESKEDTEEPAAKPSSDGKLVVAEEIKEGHITWKSINLLLSALGGNHPTLFFLVLVSWLALANVLITTQTWFLGLWGTQYEYRAPSEVRLSFYLTGFFLIILTHFTIVMSLHFFFNYRMVVASRTIHAKLVNSIFGSTFRWLDETPTARIIARCTQDVRVVDTSVASTGFWVVDMSLGALIKLGAIVLFTPIFIVPGFVVAAVGFVLGNWYLKAQLSIKREMSNARSPLLAHFNASIHGLVSIRAYGAQQAFRLESYKRIDHYTRIARTSWNVNRWVGLRMDFLGAAFTASLAFYQVYVQSSFFFGWLIEHVWNSLERIQGYLDIDHEPKSTESGQPPAAWPTSGDLRVENLSARYSQNGPRVLHNISFHVNSGERIGVVGRTGSGKSSLTLSLLRCIVTEGKVYYDDIATDSINLDALRSNITIIPQTPELLSGTLRQNLDPFEQNDDATLNDALRAAGLFSLQEEAGEARLTLDSKIAGGGGNLSVGQRQIIALARAMRHPPLTKDGHRDSADSQEPTWTDVTVITVAHRLQTIMDADKIMVLDNGNIVEFDNPKALLKKEKGALKALVDGSGDKDTLYELAEGTR